MELRMNVSELTPEALNGLQQLSEHLCKPLDMEYINGEPHIVWNIESHNAVDVVDAVDKAVRDSSKDILDECCCVNVDTVKYLDADHMCGVREFIHTSNEI